MLSILTLIPNATGLLLVPNQRKSFPFLSHHLLQLALAHIQNNHNFYLTTSHQRHEEENRIGWDEKDTKIMKLLYLLSHKILISTRGLEKEITKHMITYKYEYWLVNQDNFNIMNKGQNIAAVKYLRNKYKFLYLSLKKNGGGGHSNSSPEWQIPHDPTKFWKWQNI